MPLLFPFYSSLLFYITLHQLLCTHNIGKRCSAFDISYDIIQLIINSLTRDGLYTLNVLSYYAAKGRAAYIHARAETGPWLLLNTNLCHYLMVSIRQSVEISIAFRNCNSRTYHPCMCVCVREQCRAPLSWVGGWLV